MRTTAHSKESKIYYYLGAVPSHVVHAIPLYKKIGGVFVVSSLQAKNELEAKYNLSVLLIDRTDRLKTKVIYKVSHLLGHKARHLTLGFELRNTFRFLEENANVVIFYELYEFTPSTKMVKPKTVFLTHGNFLKDYFGMFPKRISMTKDYDYIAAIGPATKKTSIEEHGINPKKLIDIGIARTDEFIEAKGSENLQKINDTIGLSNSNPVIVYLPTFWGATSVNGLGLDIVKNINESFNLIFKPHPQTPENILNKYREIASVRKNIYIIEEANSVSLPEIMATSKAIIGDLSSVMLEAILLDKPLIFAQTDPEEAAEQYNLIQEVYEYSEKINKDNINDLNEILNLSIKKGIDKKIWDQNKSQLFYDIDGRATDSIAKFIKNIC